MRSREIHESETKNKKQKHDIPRLTSGEVNFQEQGWQMIPSSPFPGNFNDVSGSAVIFTK